MKKIIINIFWVFCALTILKKSSAQQKRMLTPADYALWDSASSIRQGFSQVSEDGQWFSYVISNPKYDSTIVQNIKTKWRYGFITSNENEYDHFGEYGSWNFSNNSKWFAAKRGDSLTILSLPDGKKQVFYGVTKFSFLAAPDKILIYKNDSAGRSLMIVDLSTTKYFLVSQVKEYAINSAQSLVVAVTEEKDLQTLQLIRVAGKCTQKTLRSGKGIQFNSFSWNKNGTAVAFCQRAAQSENNMLQDSMYIIQNLNTKPLVHAFVPARSASFEENFNCQVTKLTLSDDGTRLFFSIRPQNPEETPTASDTAYKPVQIWAFNDKEVPPAPDNTSYHEYWYCWWDNGKMIQITNAEFPCMVLTGDQTKAMIYNRRNYLPQYKYVNRFVDMYIKDLVTGRQKLLLEKVKDQPCECLASPEGKYIAYFKNKNWWVYDIAADIHRCITAGLGLNLEDYTNTSTGVIPPFGSPGWLENDNAVILYDHDDIWIFSPDGTRKQKITNGAASNITFRIFDTGIGRDGIGTGNQWFNSKLYNSKDGILLTSLDNNTYDNGLWMWTSSKGLTRILNKNKDLTHVSKFADKKPLLYIESDFDLAPRLMLLHPSGKDECVYETDPQQKQFFWGKSKVMHYETIDGKQLTGALLYPANYDSTKKYPMVVEIYERRAKEVHYYVRPSLTNTYSRDIINPTVYTANGYFVLFPNIEYELNNPGPSAVKCVTAAVQSLIDKNLVDKNRIGLTGHSFGGYETSFIITQTNLFSAAIAGAGITDLPTYYVSMSESFGSNFTRVEEDQFRMSAPFYSETYRRNSPMDNIASVQTPILLWTGDKDPNVDWTQTRNFHTALWRLGKISNLLIYPDEGHVLMNEKNKIDLTVRMQDWFDYYLKDKKPAE